MKYFISTVTALCFTLSVSVVAANDTAQNSKYKAYSPHMNDSRGKYRESNQSHKNIHRDQKKHHRGESSQYRNHDSHRGSHHVSDHSNHHRRDYGDHHRSKHRVKVGHILGGLVLGAVLVDQMHRNTTVVNKTVYVDNTPNYIDSDYLLDDYGHCYSVEYRQRGRVLTEVPYRFCQ